METKVQAIVRATTEEIFRRGGEAVSGARERLVLLEGLTIPELRVVIADQEVQLTVRKRAENVLRKKATQASGFPALNAQARAASRGHFFGSTLPRIREKRERIWGE